jgi:hypothetical protein
LANNQDKNSKIDDSLLSAIDDLIDETCMSDIHEKGATAETLDLMSDSFFTISEADLMSMQDDYVQRATFECTLESLNLNKVAGLFAEHRALQGRSADNGKLFTPYENPSPLDILSALSGRTVCERLIPIQEKLIKFLGRLPATGVTKSQVHKLAKEVQAELSTWRTVNKCPEKQRPPPATSGSVLNLTDQGEDKGDKGLTKAQEKAAKEKAAIRIACKKTLPGQKTGACMKYNYNRKDGLDHDAATTSCTESRRKNGKGECPFPHYLVDIVRRKINPAADDPGLTLCQPVSTADGSTSP